MTLPIARDLMNEGIRINTILPGTFATPMMMGLSQKLRDSLAAGVPFPRRLGDPQEFAALVVLLLEQNYMNASQVRIDGGIRAPAR
jgi:NAD(P)-dependent dehydrogenase (short-subunit alcohol dehydrogenase family)